MKVINIHSREYKASTREVGLLLDTLSSRNDLLWPHHSWPRMKFDKPLAVGAVGGHGPIRYRVEKHEPGKLVRFRFTGPKGFDGYHGYEVFGKEHGITELRQTLTMQTRGLAVISWPLMYCPLHDALIEDSLARAEVQLGLEPKISEWSTWVNLLRWVVSGGKSGPQKLPHSSRQKGR